VFNPFVPTHCSVSLTQCYRRAVLEKKRKYEEGIREVEHGTFSPLVFSCTGGMVLLATVVYKRIATQLSEKCGQSYSKTLYLLRCKLSFSLFHATITCLRGSRFSYHCFGLKESAAIDQRVGSALLSELVTSLLFLSFCMYTLCTYLKI